MVNSISNAAPVTPPQGHNPRQTHPPAFQKPAEVKDSVQLSDQAKATLEAQKHGGKRH